MRLGVGKSIFVLAGILFMACGYDWTVVSQKDTDGIGSTPPDNTSGSSGKVPPSVVTCVKNGDCGNDGFCSFPDNQCGSGAREGECTAWTSKQNCIDSVPVCGCNGQIANSRCEAEATGGGYGKTCAPRGGEFACGYLLCDSKLHFCAEKNAGPGLIEYECVTWKCSQHDCTCSETVPGKCTCEAGTDKNVTIRCGT